MNRKETVIYLRGLHDWMDMQQNFNPRIMEAIGNAIHYLDGEAFTPTEVQNILVEYGQHDPQFHLSETIKYSPNEVKEILEREGKVNV